MARKSDTLQFPPELGPKLREMRLAAGLTVKEMSRRMGRGRGFPAYLSRLERGKVKFPSMAMVADWLRVCRASFAELVPILDKYTAKPCQLEAAGREKVKEFISRLPAPVAAGLNRYDIKTTVARRFSGQAPLEPDKRELRIRKQAAAWIERGKLDTPLNREVMDHLGVDAVSPVRKYVFDYAHKLWRIMKRTRMEAPEVLSRRSLSREEQLDKAEQEELARDVVPLEGLRLVRAKTQQVFDTMERNHEFGVLPSFQQALAVPKPLSLLYRKKESSAPPPPRSLLSVDTRLLAHITNLTTERLAAEGLRDRIPSISVWLSQLGPIGIETRPGSEERASRTKAAIGESKAVELLTRVAEVYFEFFEQWRSKIFRQ